MWTPACSCPPPQDTLRECTREDKHCLSYLPALSPVYFVTFVLVAQFVLVNVVVAVLMKHLEESNKEAREDAELDAEIELELAQGPGGARRVDADRPPSPQESPGTRDTPNLLVARKVSVSRMLSLPNDSYMFRPVVPASAPHPRPLQEVEMETYGASTPLGTAAGGASGKTRAGWEAGQGSEREDGRIGRRMGQARVGQEGGWAGRRMGAGRREDGGQVGEAGCGQMRGGLGGRVRGRTGWAGAGQEGGWWQVGGGRGGWKLGGKEDGGRLGEDGVGGSWTGKQGQSCQLRFSPAPGSVASAHSPPEESCASLQIPLAVSSPARSSETLHTLSPRGTARSPSLSRLLCRQVGEAVACSGGWRGWGAYRDALSHLKDQQMRTRPREGGTGSLGL